tara:strand:- start:4879 stop:5310 length:432 start_codon:yes stop_codon:yes gene_type:complete
MILISHRGNTEGATDKENHPDYIDKTLSLGYDVEIDVWYIDSNYFLGHSQPDYKINLEFLLQRKNNLWCHAKNFEALKLMLQNDIHCFWHNKDKFTLTSKGYIFTHSDAKQYSELSIAVCLGADGKPSNCAGVCSDYIKEYEN